ncbi:ThuA domain-containing protein [Paraglaciecola aquimarina]|uniref:ThuA domain-containing protein n=1 Tax=Paraglaciecola aquimarina TaxID=1235557 RepID=A0ABU3T140_9ALTE|nr:ThuA domain-containing protein [Paraglaciecola aquimarina]MDU0355928.1 ThuA domain-containing protein [Paraglaciecola aquimarina]
MKFNQFVSVLLICVAPVVSASDINWQPNFKSEPLSQDKLAAINAALPDKPIAPAKAKRKVLIYSATSGYRHGSIPVGKVALEKLGLATHAYTAVVSDDPANFTPQGLKQFDSVVLLNTTGDFFMPVSFKKASQRDQFTDEQWQALQTRHVRLVDNLIDYVKNGGGLVGIHAATDACYSHAGYGETIGGFFTSHPWTSNMTVTVNVVDSDNGVIAPVFKKMKSFSLKDEIYQFKDVPYSREKLRILLTLDPSKSDTPKRKPEREDNDYAISWIHEVGKGRVFYTSLGHRDDIYFNPLMLNHYLAGIQYAMGDIDADATPSAHVDH